jgi:hypothetical protein
MKEFPRDRDGAIFENDLTEENLPSPVAQEESDHDEEMKTDLDDQSGDEFMREHYGDEKPQAP